MHVDDNRKETNWKSREVAAMSYHDDHDDDAQHRYKKSDSLVFRLMHIKST